MMYSKEDYEKLSKFQREFDAVVRQRILLVMAAIIAVNVIFNNVMNLI